jgi:hypothetical protein
MPPDEELSPAEGEPEHAAVVEAEPVVEDEATESGDDAPEGEDDADEVVDGTEADLVQLTTDADDVPEHDDADQHDGDEAAPDGDAEADALVAAAVGDEDADVAADGPQDGPDAADPVVADEPSAKERGERRAVPRLLVAGAALGAAIVALLSLQVVVRADEEAGGSVTRSAVALGGGPPAEATPRLGPLDPFADVRFVRIVHSEAVPMTTEPGAGGTIQQLPPGALLASDDRRADAAGIQWLHVHDAATDSWGWIVAIRAAGA